MKTTRNKFIEYIAFVTTGVFGLHLFIILTITALSYFDVFNFDKDDGVRFTLRGNVSMVEENWKPLPEESLTLKSDKLVKPIVLQKESGFVRLDFSNFQEAMNPQSALFLLLDLAFYWIWLIVTFQLMKILSLIKRQEIFNDSVVRRLKWIGLVFLISPVIVVFRDYLFSNLVVSILEIPNHYIVFPRAFKFMPVFVRAEVIIGFGIMLLFFIMSEVFRYGITIKRENDLTI